MSHDSSLIAWTYYSLAVSIHEDAELVMDINDSTSADELAESGRYEASVRNSHR